MQTLYARRLADYAVSLEFADLSPETVYEVKRRVIDSLGCALGAYWSVPATAARKLAMEVKNPFGATVLGQGQKTSADLAAFANGILVRYLDYNDTYLSKEPAHPSDNIPAALAVAEAYGPRAGDGTAGRSVITAIALAYEVQSRLCDAASLRARGWDHVAYVSASSSLLAARLMGLDAEAAANALSLAITPNMPLRQTRAGHLSMWKGCAAANAARNGVFAAFLAGGGVTGPPEVFEGEMGLMKQATGPFELDMDVFARGGGRFKILDACIKHYPSEYHSQAAVEAALALREGLDIGEIEEISIETYDACVDIIAGDPSKWAPATRETADHSLPYIVAAALTDGRMDLEQFSVERMQDPKLTALVQKVRVGRNKEHTRAYPGSFPCMITIRTRDGESRSKTVEFPRGHPKNPLTDMELEEKFSALNQGLIDKDRVKTVMDSIWRLEELSDVGELMKLFVIG